VQQVPPWGTAVRRVNGASDVRLAQPAENSALLRLLLVDQQGWTLLTAVCSMLFSVLHNACSTTIWTTYKETASDEE
jgi:hypothetical protein